MKYNFDEIIDRRNTSSYKYGYLKDFFGRDDLLPLWVADMDFATPPFIIDSIKKRLEHPVLGYVKDPVDWKPSVIEWEKSHHGWDIAPESLCFINGIMKGVGLAISRLVPEGKKVIIQPPVYHMFKYVADGAERPVVCNPLKEREDGLYDMDLENLEQVIDDDCRMLLLANPHNPGGVCWSKETLAKLADICAKHNIIVLSDEIHADMTVFGHKHVPFATVSETAAQISITFGAPTRCSTCLRSSLLGLLFLTRSCARSMSDGLKDLNFSTQTSSQCQPLLPLIVRAKNGVSRCLLM